MARAKNGQAIHPRRRTAAERTRVEALLNEAESAKDLDTWRRAKAILGYLDEKSVISMSEELGVNRSSINRWLGWYNAQGADGLRTGKPPGRTPKLTEDQRSILAAAIEEGPLKAGYSSPIWTLATIRNWIERTFGVTYHIGHLVRLVHQLGFSVQRPRKRLARADAEAQARWVNERFPAIKKKRTTVAESSSSRTKPASGSTAHSIRRGRASASSRA